MPATLADQIRKQIKTCSVLEIWGALPFRPGDVYYDVVEVVVAGDSIRLVMNLPPENQRPVLEVLKPEKAAVHEGRLEVARASAIRWDGHEYKPPASTNKPALILR